MKKIFLIFIVSIFVLGFSVNVNAITEAEKQTLIVNLQEQIEILQAQLLAMLQNEEYVNNVGQNENYITENNPNYCYTFNKNLGYVNSGDKDVVGLHIVLGMEGISVVGDDLGVYSTGTVQAVKTFQEKYAYEILTPYGLKQGTGYIGNSTRAKLNSLYGCEKIGSNIVDTSFCLAEWTCENWSACENGIQTRSCYHEYTEGCGEPNNMPALFRECSL